ncbi:siderophore-interacting protein [Herbiconiux liukaitaii]|uniref:siderophore-interacting protein n=1 Tax=Herbiconiux liukaitaii TaxID=3342799 RepID=UPI0035B6EB07
MSDATPISPTTRPAAGPGTSPGPTAGRPARPPQPQRVLTIARVEQLSPHLVRIIATGEAVHTIPDAPHTDRYAKMLFAPAGSALIPPYDLATLRETHPLAELPAQRTYTLRRIDKAAGEVWIDFVVHGDTGVAGPWAAAAQPGDAVVLAGIGGGYEPDPLADHHVLAGDESALPAIAASLEAMSRVTHGTVLIEVDGAADEIALTAPEGVTVQWVHRSGVEAGVSTALVEALRALPAPAGDTQAFVHGERGAMKALRPLLLEQWGIPRARLSLSAYWAHGRIEDAFQAEKREPVGQIFTD